MYQRLSTQPRSDTLGNGLLHFNALKTEVKLRLSPEETCRKTKNSEPIKSRVPRVIRFYAEIRISLSLKGKRSHQGSLAAVRAGHPRINRLRTLGTFNFP